MRTPHEVADQIRRRQLRRLQRLLAQMLPPEPWEEAEPAPAGPSFMDRAGRIFRKVIDFAKRRLYPLAEVVILTSLGALVAKYAVLGAGFHGIGMVGVGVGVGHAVGPVALVLGGIVGLAVYGLISLRRRLV